MRVHDEMKRRHEMAIAQLFILAVGEAEGLVLRAPRHGVTGEPDVICLAASGEHGLEIADGYLSPGDATELWGIAREAVRAGEARTLVSSSGFDSPHVIGMVTNPDTDLIAGLQAALNKHCLKRYAVTTDLILNASHAPLASTDDAPAILAGLKLPQPCPYRSVWLCLGVNFSWERRFFRVGGA